MWLNLLSITDNLKIVLKFSVGGQDRLFKSRVYFMNEMCYKTYQINLLNLFFRSSMLCITALIFKSFYCFPQ